jgi:cbb3-type cytochrome oxidase subunit 3
MWSETIATWWIWVVPIAFVVVLLYAFSPKRKKQFDAEARIPLEDDKPRND